METSIYQTSANGIVISLAFVRRWLRLLAADPFALISLMFLLIVVASALFAGKISPYGPNAQDISARLIPPMWAGGTTAHLLGTDALGRDIFSRLIYGTRMALLIPLVGVSVSLSLGVVLGLVAGFYGGKADAIIMRIADLKLALSSFLLLMVIIVMIGPGVVTLMIVFGITYWVLYGRMVRGALLSLREAPFVQAARIIGCSDIRIMLTHIMPSLVPTIISVAIVEMARLMVAEAGLSFLGFGVQPPTITWGLMLAAGREYLSVAWWVVAFPGLAITLTVLAMSLVGMWLRAISDPLRGRLTGRPSQAR